MPSHEEVWETVKEMIDMRLVEVNVKDGKPAFKLTDRGRKLGLKIFGKINGR